MPNVHDCPGWRQVAFWSGSFLGQGGATPWQSQICWTSSALHAHEGKLGPPALHVQPDAVVVQGALQLAGISGHAAADAHVHLGDTVPVH